MTIRPLARPSNRTPDDGEAWTVLNLVLWSAHYLAERGVENARLDAEHLLADVLSTTRLELYLQHDRPMGTEELAEFKPRLKRRAAREPLQYILGRAPFRELDLRVDGRALIPRPETESLVGAVLGWAKERGVGDLSALDVGTGSGAIAISLAVEGGFATVVATDASASALELARENVDACVARDSVQLREGSLFDPVGHEERFDVVVSNPPYVRGSDMDGLQPEVRDWEPRAALDAGPDGLAVIVPLVRDAGRHLRAGGLLALEVGAGQGRDVTAMLESDDRFGAVRVENDLAGHQRMVFAERMGPRGSSPPLTDEINRLG